MLKIRFKNFELLCFAVTELLNLASAASNYGLCTTPDLITGACVNLADCSYLEKLLRTPNLSDNEIKLLRASQCGYLNDSVLICCPEHYRTSKIDRPASPNPDAGSLPTCGRVRAGAASYPWMALIKYKNSDTEESYRCGGTLINERYVLTAAYCVGRDPTRIEAVRLGELNLETDRDCDESGCAPSPQDISVSEVIAHPNYRPVGNNDIALLRLETNAKLNEYVMPICLPTQRDLRSDTFNDANMEVAVWEKTSSVLMYKVQQKASAIVTNLSECQTVYRRLLVTPSMMCVRRSAANSSCQGDVSLMFQHEINGQAVHVLTGVAPKGPSICRGSELHIYTRVGAFMDWIENTIRP